MVIVDEEVSKQLKKGKPPIKIFKSFYKALIDIDKEKNIKLYDCLPYKDQHHKYTYTYYRIRKGDYRGIFRFDDSDTILVALGKRDEIYSTKLI